LLNYTTVPGNTNLMVRKSYDLGSQHDAFAASSHWIEANVDSFPLHDKELMESFVVGQFEKAEMALWPLEQIMGELDNIHTRCGCMMTIIQESGLRVQSNQPVDPLQCKHLNLELEWDDNDHSRDNSIWILCG